MTASVIAFAWFGLAFPVGAARGSRAGAFVLVVGLWTYILALAGTVGWAIAVGEWAKFVASVGIGALFEMAVFVGIWQYIVYFMASRYLSDTRRREIETARVTESTHA